MLAFRSIGCVSPSSNPCCGFDRSSPGGAINFQRLGATSNTKVGNDFTESVCQMLLEREGLQLVREFSVDVGFSSKKGHRFDLGGDLPPTLVECRVGRSGSCR